VLIALCIQCAVAQVTSAGSIAGQVADATGAVIPHATVIAVQNSTNVQWKTVSGATGLYLFPNLPVGAFTLTAQLDGFSTSQINDIKLSAGEQLRYNFSLKPGTVTDTVQVSSDSIAVDTMTGNVGEVISGESLQAMPLVTRNFTQLVGLVAGVSSDIGSDNGFGSNSSLAASVNGGREDSNNWTIDGVPNLDVYNGNNAIIPNEDAIAEFRIDRGNYTAEQGRSSGATINAILKQGANQFHGTAFEYIRNTIFNANSYSNNLGGVERPNQHYNNWGYTLGGPIKKDKLFFFWSEEWRRIIEPNGTQSALVPTKNEIDGNFSDWSAMNLQQPIVSHALAANPLCVGCVEGKPFPNNQIPKKLLNPTSLLLLNTYYPKPQFGTLINGANYFSSLPTTTTVREELIRLDYNINDKWKAFAHYIQDQNHISAPYSQWGENPLPNVNGTHEFEPLHSFGIDLVGTFTPNLSNEIEFGIYHNIIRITEDSTISRSRASGLDIPYYFPSPHYNADNRIPQMHFSYFANINTNWPFLNGFFYHKWTDNLSWHRGNHTLRFGLLVTQQGKNEDNQDMLGNGSFSWWGSQTQSDLADMLTNYADQYSEAENNPMQHLRYWDNEAYAQDQWQATHKLNLTFGLRYTFFSPETDQNNLLTNFYPTLYSSSLAPTVNANGSLNPTSIPVSQLSDGVYLPTNGIVVAGSNSPYGDAVFKAPKLNMAPRMGFSYDVTGRGKTVVRGGYGMYFDRTAPYSLGGKSNPPFNANVTLSGVTVSDPASSGGTKSYTAVSLSALNRKYTNPDSQQWSLGIQHELRPNMVLSVEGVRTQGTHLLYNRQLNQNSNQLEVAKGNVHPDAARPYLGYSAIAMFMPGASSTYNGLQTSLRDQIGKSITIEANYTYSKVLTNAPNDSSSPQNSKNLKADRGLASFDKTHMLKADWVWKLPEFSGNRTVHLVAGGWQWSGLMSFQSGAPIGVTLSVPGIKYSNSGVSDSTQRPNLVGKSQANKNFKHWLNLDAFAKPDLGTFGTAGVAVGRMPHVTQVDSALSKEFVLTKYLRMQFNLSAINVLNHAQFTGIDSTYIDNPDSADSIAKQNPNFGLISAGGTPRKMQAGIHFTF
jgi:hypothetical protein